MTILASQATANVVVVEDEESLVTLLRYNLERAGFGVTVARDGDEALHLIRDFPPDLVVLDWMLPSASGLDVCRSFRRDPALKNLPVIMLTARGEEADKIRGLDSGADDYVTKPFSPAELIARIHALLRRAKPGFAEETLSHGDIAMDLAGHRVHRGGREVELRPAEFRLLRYFLERPGRVLSREQLLDAVWGQDIYVEARTVDVHVGRLRKALNAGGAADVIRTVRSAGYALDAAHE